jgi:hypothetical protein
LRFLRPEKRRVATNDSKTQTDNNEQRRLLEVVVDRDAVRRWLITRIAERALELMDGEDGNYNNPA